MKTGEEIERIVLEVIRRLTAAKPAAKPAAGPAANSHGVSLEIRDRVVTLSTIDQRLDGVGQLVVQPKAVVTPSVQDELRTHNVQLVRLSRPTHDSTTRRLLVANLGSTPIENIIGDLPCDVTMFGQGSLEATIQNMTSQLTENALGVIFTQQPEAAVCLANRHRNVNAFVGWERESVRRATSTMAANLLVLAASSSSNAMQDMLRQFVTIPGGSAG